MIRTPDVLEPVSGNGWCVFPRRPRDFGAQETSFISSHFSHGFVAQTQISIGNHAFSGRPFWNKCFSWDICNVLSVQPLGMRLFVPKQCRVADEVHELFDTMGTVLRRFCLASSTKPAAKLPQTPPTPARCETHAGPRPRQIRTTMTLEHGATSHAGRQATLPARPTTHTGSRTPVPA